MIAEPSYNRGEDLYNLVNGIHKERTSYAPYCDDSVPSGGEDPSVEANYCAKDSYYPVPYALEEGYGEVPYHYYSVPGGAKDRSVELYDRRKYGYYKVPYSLEECFNALPVRDNKTNRKGERPEQYG